MLWHERASLRRIELGLSKAEIARRCGSSYDVINKYFRGHVEQPRGNAFSKIASVLQVSETWLRYGTDFEHKNEIGIEIVGQVAQGIWVSDEGWSSIKPEKTVISVRDTRYPSSEQIAFKISGHALGDLASDGDYLIVRKPESGELLPPNNSKVIVKQVDTKNNLTEFSMRRVVVHASTSKLVHYHGLGLNADTVIDPNENEKSTEVVGHVLFVYRSAE